MAYVSSADGVLEVDRRADSPRSKRAAWVKSDDAADRQDQRDGAVELDAAVQAARIPQSSKDVQRSFPRSRVADLGHPVMERTLPEPDAKRVPLSSRQRKERSKTKYEAWRRLPQRTYEALRDFLGNADGPDSEWRRIGNHLAEVAGDLQYVGSEDVARDARRIDRGIQAYESRNDRGHVVYANARMPFAVNHSNIEGFARNQFGIGDVVVFDRYTAGAHTMHEVERDIGDNERTLVFEIQTRRGAYVGQSDASDNTAHLLPRAMRMKVVGSHVAQFVRPDGTTGERVVVQMVDVDSVRKG